MALDLPTEFENADDDHPPVLPIVVRDRLDERRASALLSRIAGTDWGGLEHAYGPAGDVPAQLAAVVVGDAATRRLAWWNLWGNVHHQGTVYAATVPAVAVLARIAGWREHPDRVQALAFLRELAAGEGTSEAAVDAALAAELPALFDGWREEPEPVRRGLLWVLGACPGLRRRHADLVDALLPEEHRAAWEVVTSGAIPPDDDAYDAYVELESWAVDEP